MLVARLRTLRYRRRRRKDVGLGAGHEAHEHQHVTGRQRPGGGRKRCRRNAVGLVAPDRRFMTAGGSPRSFVPPGVRAALWYFLKGCRDPGMSWRLARLRETIWTRPKALVRFAGYEIRIAEGSSFYHQCRYIFADRVYHFEVEREDPLIIDGGSNIGIPILYFKSIYPSASVRDRGASQCGPSGFPIM
jgi:hypothetical protein